MTGKWGQAPPSKTPPPSGTFGAPSHPTKSAPHLRDFAGTPGSAQPFGSGRRVWRSREDGLTHRAEPVLTASHDLAEVAR
jgi:hypothetical protein